jgi:hypothetical protein
MTTLVHIMLAGRQHEQEREQRQREIDLWNKVPRDIRGKRPRDLGKMKPTLIFV